MSEPISEIILNAILNLFAILSSFQEQKTSTTNVVENYLRRHLGIGNPEIYLDLYEELLDFYQTSIDVESKEAGDAFFQDMSRQICNNISSRLSQNERFFILLHLLELMKEQGGTTVVRLDEMWKIAAASFSMSKRELDDIKQLIFAPYQTEALSDRFLLITNHDITGPLKCKHLRQPDIQGQLTFLYIKSIEVFVFMHAGKDILRLDNNPLETGRFYQIQRGSLIHTVATQMIYYSQVVEFFRSNAAKENISFKGVDVDFKFPGTKNGIHHFSFSEKSGRLVGVMGGSGVGKSTLLSLLNGSLRPDSGKLLINRHDLYETPDKLEGIIGFVPQDDLLFEDLTVYENLYYSAKLCLSNLTANELAKRVDEILEDLNQLEIKDLKVGSPVDKTISGGQRKRLNIALELIREPAILFVDEPTSGLSSSDSVNVMSLLDEQAKKGKLVIVIIHQPSSEIFRMFDKLWILDKGGYPIFDGPPLDAIVHFRSLIKQASAEEWVCPQCGNIDPDQIFSIIEMKRIDEAGNITRERQYAPKYWHEFYLAQKENERSATNDARDISQISGKHLWKPGLLGQFSTFLKRNVLAKVSNKQYLIINLLEAPVLAYIIAQISRYSPGTEYVFRENKNLSSFIFMSIIVSIFIGLSISAEEIISDRKVLQREKFLHLSWFSYISSKVVYLISISALLMLLYVWIGNSILEIPDMMLKNWGILFSCAVFANLLGLNISAGFKRAVTIYILIPLLLVPQILLCGLVVKFDDLIDRDAENNHVPLVGNLMTSRWAFEAFAVEHFRSNRFHSNFFYVNREISRYKFILTALIPELKSKADYLAGDYPDPDKDAKKQQYSDLLKNEIQRLEKKCGIKSGMSSEVFTPGIFSHKDALALKAYLKTVSRFYKDKKRDAVSRQEEIVFSLVKRHGKEDYLNLKKNYHNKGIAELVLNSKDYEDARVSGARIVQKSTPVYKTPESRTGNAHFYAGEKHLGDRAFGTYDFNLLVIWAMILILYITLYFDLIAKTFFWAGKISYKLSKKLHGS